MFIISQHVGMITFSKLEELPESGYSNLQDSLNDAKDQTVEQSVAPPEFEEACQLTLDELQEANLRMNYDP